MIKIDNRLKKLLYNKRIAYICPGQHLIDSKLGEKIDSYDLIIRINQKFEIPENQINDYGKRTDIIFSAFSNRCVYECKNNWDYFKNNKDLKMGVVAQLPDKGSINFKDYFEKKLNIPYILFDRKEILKIYKKVGTNVTTGLIGLYILLECKVKEIFVAGINFYNFGNYGNVYYKSYYDSITEGKNNERQFAPNDIKKVTPQNTRYDLVNLHNHIQAFKKLVKKNKDIIILDDYLKDNLNKYNKQVYGYYYHDENNEISNHNYEVLKQINVLDKLIILKNKKSLFDINYKCTHFVYFNSYDYKYSTSEVKNFINFFIAYNLDLLITIENKEYYNDKYTERVKPTVYNDTLISFHDEIYKKYDMPVILNSKIIAGNSIKIKNIFNEGKELYYKQNKNCDCFLLDSIDSQGMYIPLKRALQADLK